MRLTQTVQDQVLIRKDTNDVEIIDNNRIFTVNDYINRCNASPWHVDVETLNMALEAEGYKELEDIGVYIEYKREYERINAAIVHRAVIPQSKYEEIKKTSRIDRDILNWCNNKMRNVAIDDFIMKSRNDVEYYMDNVINIYSLKCGDPIMFVVIDDRLITADVNSRDKNMIDMCVTDVHDKPFIIENIANIEQLTNYCEKRRSIDSICIKSDMIDELYKMMMQMYKYHKQKGDI